MAVVLTRMAVQSAGELNHITTFYNASQRGDEGTREKCTQKEGGERDREIGRDSECVCVAVSVSVSVPSPPLSLARARALSLSPFPPLPPNATFSSLHPTQLTRYRPRSTTGAQTENIRARRTRTESLSDPSNPPSSSSLASPYLSFPQTLEQTTPSSACALTESALCFDERRISCST
eukprot:2534996-Rhodomonas_salina.1